MKVGIATDHGGFGLKEELMAKLHAAGHQVVDFGAHSLNAHDDYPDFVVPLAEAAAGPAVAWDLVEAYLTAEYSQAERHLRRLGKVASIEAPRFKTQNASEEDI
jgi:ribose 5-phosphate isomerase RpiB